MPKEILHRHYIIIKLHNKKFMCEAVIITKSLNYNFTKITQHVHCVAMEIY